MHVLDMTGQRETGWDHPHLGFDSVFLHCSRLSVYQISKSVCITPDRYPEGLPYTMNITDGLDLSIACPATTISTTMSQDLDLIHFSK